ncbi:phytanoyl-CoA dioxygenase family protein [Pedobacter metabolipauper]|uniref:Phytanoyl-CoA dioxygenase PhyH n=1 Tax=Pedobacter metabolipauper TaxID=425513 RepID=A0A4R6SZA5_9SPHI|nr:phytanoyl-CoA dioxygenase family protein [Pedobacter metabolipauper]TDQ11402.1 phytanoyl-CoA dioxygenase PhyH [Pedobacter metabolipauper]
MLGLNSYQEQLEFDGYTIIENVFSEAQIHKMLLIIDRADTSRKTFRKSADLFAIRQFLKEVPEINELIFNDDFKNLIQQLFGKGQFVVKSIYFDKPGQSNWFVSYHQDLTISVDQKVDLENYNFWTVKQDQFAVQPPLEILKQIYTVRIHLDDTDENNGALKVIKGSHLKNIYRPEDIDWANEQERTCNVPQGGIMIMKPLLLHSSSRTVNNKKRRVIHIEFCNQELPQEINWAERMEFAATEFE